MRLTDAHAMQIRSQEKILEHPRKVAMKVLAPAPQDILEGVSLTKRSDRYNVIWFQH